MKKIAVSIIISILALSFEVIGQVQIGNDLDGENPPEAVLAFRKQIAAADGVLICTPEYVFTLPGSLKNALEWCVSTTIFSQKPTGLITASAKLTPFSTYTAACFIPAA